MRRVQKTGPVARARIRVSQSLTLQVGLLGPRPAALSVFADGATHGLFQVASVCVYLCL